MTMEVHTLYLKSGKYFEETSRQDAHIYSIVDPRPAREILGIKTGTSPVKIGDSTVIRGGMIIEDMVDRNNSGLVRV